jgi:riboflavin kinase/FMN adenylyltransferase
MEAIHGWAAVPARFRGGSVAIGTFDGVHRGHQAVIAAAKAAATPLDAPVGAMIFEPYPRSYFQPGKPFFRLTTLERKLELLQRCGCDFTAIIPFDRQVANMPAETFVRQVLWDGYGVRHACVGFNFLFGKGRDGNPARLQALGESLGFSVSVVAPAGGAGEIFSATRVRELLAEGDVAAAADMLGYPWQVEGEVVGGAGRGTGLGFPTANIHLDEGVALRHGIYAVRVHIEGEVIDGASYLGTRPTFDGGPAILETFLFDFDGNLYGKTIAIDFIAFVRGDAKFKSAETLMAQMRADCARAAELLAMDRAQANAMASDPR